MMMLLKLNQQLIPGLADVLQQVADLKDATNSMFARLGTDYESRNQWFFAILEAMTTD